MLLTERHHRYTIIRLLAGSLFLYYLLITISVAGGADLNRKLSFYNTHTREHLTVIYKKGDYYVPEPLEKINYVLRDHRTEMVHPIDPKLMDYLYDLLTEVGNHGEVHIISGYRAPETNTAVLRDKALTMKQGGVGYYKKSDFIQIDTGRVRRW